MKHAYCQRGLALIKKQTLLPGRLSMLPWRPTLIHSEAPKWPQRKPYQGNVALLTSFIYLEASNNPPLQTWLLLTYLNESDFFFYIYFRSTWVTPKPKLPDQPDDHNADLSLGARAEGAPAAHELRPPHWDPVEHLDLLHPISSERL